MADWLCGEGGDFFYKETSHQGHCAARSLVPTPQCLVPPRAGLLRALQNGSAPSAGLWLLNYCLLVIEPVTILPSLFCLKK